MVCGGLWWFCCGFVMFLWWFQNLTDLRPFFLRNLLTTQEKAHELNSPHFLQTKKEGKERPEVGQVFLKKKKKKKKNETQKTKKEEKKKG